MTKKSREESHESASDRGRRAAAAKAELTRAREVKALRESIAAAKETERRRRQAAIDEATKRAREERLQRFRDSERRRDR